MFGPDHAATRRLLGVVALGLTLGISAPGAAQEPRRAEQTQVIVARDGRLTVRAHAVPLVKLLRLIAARTGVGVAVAGDLDAPVTADLDDVEPGEAIRQLVRNHATVWIARPAARRPDGADSADVRVRARAVTALAALKTAEAAAALRTALGDSAPSVRIQAAYALRRSQGVAAVPALANVAVNDPDPKVRLVAVRALSFLPGAASARALERASRDPDASVRQEAARRLGAHR